MNEAREAQIVHYFTQLVLHLSADSKIAFSCLFSSSFSWSLHDPRRGFLTRPTVVFHLVTITASITSRCAHTAPAVVAFRILKEPPLLSSLWLQRYGVHQCHRSICCAIIGTRRRLILLLRLLVFLVVSIFVVRLLVSIFCSPSFLVLFHSSSIRTITLLFRIAVSVVATINA
jgi:hypothetical protein